MFIKLRRRPRRLASGSPSWRVFVKWIGAEDFRAARQPAHSVRADANTIDCREFDFCRRPPSHATGQAMLVGWAHRLASLLFLVVCTYLPARRHIAGGARTSLHQDCAFDRVLRRPGLSSPFSHQLGEVLSPTSVLLYKSCQGPPPTLSALRATHSVAERHCSIWSEGRACVTLLTSATHDAATAHVGRE